MDPTLVAQFTAGIAAALRQQQDEQMLRIGRQSDGAQYDNRALGATLAGVLMGANDPERYASYGAASHVPTSQPWMAPPWVSSAGFGTMLPGSSTGTAPK
jgi:hypothetical protein